MYDRLRPHSRSTRIFPDEVVASRDLLGTRLCEGPHEASLYISPLFQFFWSILEIYHVVEEAPVRTRRLAYQEPRTTPVDVLLELLRALRVEQVPTVEDVDGLARA